VPSDPIAGDEKILTDPVTTDGHPLFVVPSGLNAQGGGVGHASRVSCQEASIHSTISSITTVSALICPRLASAGTRVRSARAVARSATLSVAVHAARADTVTPVTAMDIG
jgi:hypothetical protein